MSDIALKELIDKDDIDSGEETAKSVESIADKSDISDESASELLLDQDLESKYGDQDLRTFAESAASGASFGISDQLLTKTGLVSQEELRERRKRNSEAAIAGEITGIVAPALLSGGASVLGAGVKGAAKAGIAVEKLTASAIKKLIKETGKKSLAKEVIRKGITKGAGSAVEGSFYGTGKLISEEALGNADFNAENLLSHAGTSAAFGGVLGGTFGTISAAVPIVKGNKITSWATKKLKGTMNPEQNAAKLSGMSPTQIYKQRTFNPTIYTHTPKMLKEVANKKGLSAFSGNNKLFNSVKEFIKESGDDIGKTLDTASDVLAAKGALPTKSKVAQRIINKLDDFSNKFKDADGRVLKTSAPKVNRIKKIMKEFDEDLISKKTMTAQELNALKAKYQSLAKWNKLGGNIPINEEINREISRALREEVLEVATTAGGEIGNRLKKNLLDYGSATEFAANFGKYIDTANKGNWINIKDMFLGGMFGEAGIGIAAANRFAKSDLKKRLMILSNIEKSNQAVTKKINTGVSKFLKGETKPFIPAASRALLTSKLSRKEENGEFKKKPKTKQEAFKNIKTNVQELASNPDKVSEMLTIGNIEEAAPESANMAAVTIGNSIQFLNSKLPKDGRITGAFTRPYEPSTMEMAKFEKYLKAIENPLSVLDDLQSGIISRESIEAIQAVYPNLYNRIQENVLEKVAKDPEAITYQQRLTLGVVLDIPTDISLQPMVIKALQSHFAEAQQSQSGGTIAPNQSISPSAAAKVDIAESRASEVTKVSNRRDLE